MIAARLDRLEDAATMAALPRAVPNEHAVMAALLGGRDPRTDPEGRIDTLKRRAEQLERRLCEAMRARAEAAVQPAEVDAERLARGLAVLLDLSPVLRA